MHFENLYQQARWKKQHQIQVQQSKQQLIKQQASKKKMNHKSNMILATKLYQKLLNFQDEALINIETCIPILYATGILKAIQNIESAQMKLQKGEFQNSRLRDEARFVYCLWKMIDEEQIQTRQLKQIIYVLNNKPIGDLKKSFIQSYHDEQAVSELVQTWRILTQDSKYYKAVEKRNQKMSDREIEKIMNYDPVLKQKSFLSEFKDIQQCFLKDQHYHSKDHYNNLNFITMESLNYSSKNKENVFMDRASEKSLVDRLYRIDKYRVREAQKKIEEEKKVKAELDQCTFKPQINNDRLRSASNNKRSRSVNGFEKSVNRMKVGNEKQRIEKQLREHKPAGQNYYKLRQKNINPPKFLDRKKTEQPIQFIIEFDLGRHKVKVKVREQDSPEAIARNLCKIYCLKQDYFEQICLIIRKERVAFYQQRLQ